MPIIDVILIVILSGFGFYGLFYGLIRMFGFFIGLFVGAILASRFYLLAADLLEPMFFGYNNIGKVLAFIILFSLISRLTGFGFVLVEKAFNLLAIIPFLKTINRLAGATLGLAVGALAIGLCLYVASRHLLLGSFLGIWLENSVLAPLFLKFSHIFLPLLPEVLKSIQGLI